MADFFKPPPPIEIAKEPRREDWMGPSPDVVPAVVPVERVVAHINDIVIYLSGFWVYPAGFETQILVLAKDEKTDLDPFSYDYEELAEQSGEIPPGRLRIGFEFADGSKITNTGEDFAQDWPPGLEPTSPKMSSTGGRGGRNREDGNWAKGLWVWPLPPPGSLTFVCEWPAAEIPLIRFELDAAVILDAVSRAQELFG